MWSDTAWSTRRSGCSGWIGSSGYDWQAMRIRTPRDWMPRPTSRAAGRSVGALAEGHRADIVLLDPDHPTLAGRTGDTLLDAWVFSATGSPVSDVMVGGRWVVRDGHHDSAEAIAHRYRATMERLRS